CCRANRVPPGFPHRLPAAAERRFGACRLPADGAAGGPPPREGGRHSRVRTPAQDAAELACTLRPRVARGGCRSALCDRSPPGDPCRGARPGGARRAHEGLAVSRAPAPAKINLALVVGPLR